MRDSFPVDREDVEARFRAGRDELQEISGERAELLAFSRVDRRERGPVAAPSAHLYLDEHEGLAVARYQVDLAPSAAHVPSHDAVAQAPQMLACGVFA